MQLAGVAGGVWHTVVCRAAEHAYRHARLQRMHMMQGVGCVVAVMDDWDGHVPAWVCQGRLQSCTSQE
jgi:hypothetical protein